ncbi:MAG: acyltransferase [Candidatus Shapirobacteria bacterium]|jgi:peptidoglycan/LPS O-acetylase OafA/YrhL
MKQTTISNHKNLGLDIARCVAILFVLIAHGTLFFWKYNTNLNNLIMLGFFGVEIFFALSGYLIGGILLKDVFNSDNSKKVNLFRFYLRRWFRTLPLYYIVVFVLFLKNRDTFTWQNLLFLQNFDHKSLNFFAVSWSLSIEEWFYFFIPLVIFLVIKSTRKTKSSFLGVCLFFIIFSPIARILLVTLSDPSFDFGVRKQILFRFDAMSYGMLFAGLRHFYPNIFKNLVKGKIFLITSLVGFLISFIYYVPIQFGKFNELFFARTLFFSFVAISSSIFVVGLEKITTNISSKNFFTILVSFVSLTSYSAYLVHTEVFSLFLKIDSSTNNILISGLTFLFALMVVFLISGLSYNYFEKYWLKLRDKITK